MRRREKKRAGDEGTGYPFERVERVVAGRQAD